MPVFKPPYNSTMDIKANWKCYPVSFSCHLQVFAFNERKWTMRIAFLVFLQTQNQIFFVRLNWYKLG